MALSLKWRAGRSRELAVTCVFQQFDSENRHWAGKDVLPLSLLQAAAAGREVDRTKEWLEHFANASMPACDEESA